MRTQRSVGEIAHGERALVCGRIKNLSGHDTPRRQFGYGLQAQQTQSNPGLESGGQVATV
jgi:hypothetical protein